MTAAQAVLVVLVVPKAPREPVAPEEPEVLQAPQVTLEPPEPAELVVPSDWVARVVLGEPALMAALQELQAKQEPLAKLERPERVVH